MAGGIPVFVFLYRVWLNAHGKAPYGLFRGLKPELNQKAFTKMNCIIQAKIINIFRNYTVFVNNESFIIDELIKLLPAGFLVLSKYKTGIAFRIKLLERTQGD